MALSENNIKTIKNIFNRLTVADLAEKIINRMREIILGVNGRIFDKTIRYFEDVKGQKFSRREALKKALDKARHKEAWFRKDRETVDDIMHFYREVDIYPFRQPYLKRFGGFRWYRRLVGHIEKPSILEYGCGSAVLTEWLMEKFPECRYSIADIPSVTLDFVRWKKNTYGYGYDILEISKGKEGIPLKDNYDLIICQDVLEHTPNPLEIVQGFCDHLNPDGILLIDFINHAEGENLSEAMSQRSRVKQYLRDNLYPIKHIDEPNGNSGVYLKR